jgi:hypothetical protein
LAASLLFLAPGLRGGVVEGGPFETAPAQGAVSGGQQEVLAQGAVSGGQQEVLEEEALRFAAAWVNGDTRTLAGMLAPDGIRLHVQGDLHPSVDPNRAAGALRAFLEKYAGGEAELMRVSHTAGDPPTGFADLQWRTLVAGTGEVVIFTLFVAFADHEGSWAVTEIRVLP